MLFAGQNPGIRKIIGWQTSYPPKPIYGKGNEIAYDPDFGDTFGSDDADLNWAIPDPDRPTIYGSDVLDLLIQNEQVMKPGQSPGDDRSKEPYDKDWPAPAPLAPKLANSNGIAPYTDPLSGWKVDGGTDMQHLLRSLGLPDNKIAMGNPSFDIGGGHRGANRNAKIYNKLRANYNENEIKIIKDMLSGPSLPPF